MTEQTLTPVFQACPPRKAEQSAENYAQDLRRSLTNELATSTSATQFLLGSYNTPAMKDACQMIFSRLREGDASDAPSVYRFHSRFGGGKTHTLIILAAIAKHPWAARGLPEEYAPLPPEEIADDVHLVAFNGDDSNAVEGTHIGEGVRAFSPIGVLAYELGGKALYERYAAYDRNLQPPGGQELEDIIGDKPTLILLDEMAQWMAAMRDKAPNESLAMIIGNLARAAANCPRAVLVVTAPESYADALGAANAALNAALEDLTSVLSRVSHEMTPSTSQDDAAILRRRLFRQVDEKARNAAADAYGAIAARLHPADSANARRRFYDSYPFHPETIRIIQERLASNNNFQRVRGTLHLLAQVIQANLDTDSALLHPHHISARVPEVRNALVNRIEFHNLDAAIDADIADEQSTRAKLASPLVEKALNVALLGSLSHVVKSGIDDQRAVNAIVSPQDPDESLIRQAISAVRDAALFINENDPGALRFSEDPNIRREVLNRQDKFSNPATIADKVKELVSQTFRKDPTGRGPNALEAHIYPTQIPDDPDAAHLAIINSEYAHANSRNLKEDIERMYVQSDKAAGKQLREHSNHAIFLVAKESNSAELNNAARRLMAAEDVKKNPSYDLERRQKNTLDDIIAQASKDAYQCVQSIWTEMFYPSVDNRFWDDVSLRHDTLTHKTDKAGYGQAAVIEMLETRAKTPSAHALAFNKSVWEKHLSPQRNDGLELSALRRKFSGGPGEKMILNPSHWSALIDAALANGFIEMALPDGAALTSPRGGLGYSPQCKVWLAGAKPKAQPKRPAPAAPPAPPINPTAPTISPPAAPLALSVEHLPGRAAQAELTRRMQSNNLAYDRIADLTVHGAGIELLQYIASLAPHDDVKMRYSFSTADEQIRLDVQDRPLAQWTRSQQAIKSLVDRHRSQDPEEGDLESASATLYAAEVGADAIEKCLTGLDNSQIVTLQARFAPEESQNE